MCGVTCEDKMRNKYVRGSNRLASIVQKKREDGLRRFGNVVRSIGTVAVRVVIRMNVEAREGKRKPKIRLRLI